MYVSELFLIYIDHKDEMLQKIVSKESFFMYEVKCSTMGHASKIMVHSSLFTVQLLFASLIGEFLKMCYVRYA